jgi:hypothetical protein
MKKILIISTILFTMSISPFAQEINEKKWTFEGHAGITLAKMRWADKIKSTNTFFVQYPETKYRTSYTFGLGAGYQLTNKWRVPLSMDFVKRRFAIGTTSQVVFVVENGQLTAVKADNIDYRVNQISISSGIGYQILEDLWIDLMPYFQTAISDQEIRIIGFNQWSKDETFKQNNDYGIGGRLAFNLKSVTLSGGYQFGLRDILEYSAFDAIGSPIGKFPINNTMFHISIGYQF